jgi:hypothetical protein
MYNNLEITWLRNESTRIISVVPKASLYLDGSGSNAVDQCDEEEDDEGVQGALHAILLSIHSVTPLAFSQDKKRWSGEGSVNKTLLDNILLRILHFFT